MQFIFIAIYIIGAIYFLLKKRRFDFFSLAFISACVYFLPGVFGYSLYPLTEEQVPLITQAYLVMILVMISVIISGFFYDLYKKENTAKIQLKFNDYGLTLKLFIFVSIISFFLMVITTGGLLFNEQKSIVLESLNRFHTLWTFSTMLWVVLSFIKKKKVLFIVGFAFLLFDVFIGFRSKMAITIIAILTIYLNRQGMQVLVMKWRALFLSTLFVMFFFIYKKLHAVIKLGRWDIVIERITSMDFYKDSIITSEPFNTQTVLNSILLNDYKVGTSHLSDIIQLVLPLNPIADNSRDFNSLYQNALFPEVDYGMASNIWAEMYSSGGWLLLIAFILIFNLCLFLGTSLLTKNNNVLITTTSLVMSYWAFYIHRNSLIYELNLIKTLVIISFTVAITALFISTTIRKKQSRDRSYKGVYNV